MAKKKGAINPFSIIGFSLIIVGLLIATGILPLISGNVNATTTIATPTTSTVATTSAASSFQVFIKAVDQNGNSLPASVSIDGSIVGSAPLVDTLASGTHTVSCGAITGYNSVNTSFQVSQAQTVTCTYSVTTSSVVTIVTTTSSTTVSSTVTGTSSVSSSGQVALVVTAVLCNPYNPCATYANAHILVYSSSSSATPLASGYTGSNGQVTLFLMPNIGNVVIDWVNSANDIVGQSSAPIGASSPVTAEVTATSSYGLSLFNIGGLTPTSALILNVGFGAVLGALGILVIARGKMKR